MKKLILVLAICLIASPVFAATIFLEKGTGNVINVKYSGNGTTAATRIRGAALDLTLTGGNFTSFVASSFKTGESTASSRGYGIYPATIVIDSTGAVTDSGTPLAYSGDPGAGSGFGSNHIVLEFGSLYFGDANAPAASGTLCSINYSAGSSVTMNAEVTYRGGVVMEDGSQATGTGLPMTLTLSNPPSPATNGVPANGTDGINPATTTAISWTAGANATSYDVLFGTVNPPAGTPVNVTTTSYAVSLVKGKTYYASVVAKNDSGSAAALVWNFSTNCMKSTAAGYANWVAAGKPDCWCYQYQGYGDINGKEQGTGLGTLRIGSVDLGLFSPCYGKKRAQVNGTACICADLNHIDQGTGLGALAVGSVDLGIFSSYYGKKTSQLPNPVSYAADYYYWVVAP